MTADDKRSAPMLGDVLTDLVREYPLESDFEADARYTWPKRWARLEMLSDCQLIPPLSLGIDLSRYTTRQLIYRLAHLARRQHDTCEDPWYSCPKSPGGCFNDAAGTDCDCGADAINAEIDRILLSLKIEAVTLPEME